MQRRQAAPAQAYNGCPLYEAIPRHLIEEAEQCTCGAEQGLPYSGSAGTVFLYGIILATMGLTISWAAPACNNPVFAEVPSSALQPSIHPSIHPPNHPPITLPASAVSKTQTGCAVSIDYHPGHG